MRIAALYDIHGNLPALEAVLDEVARLGIDQLVIGGDVFPGPMAIETLDRLQRVDLPVHFIYGNGEVAVLDEMAGTKPAVPDSYRPVIQWHAEQLTEKYKEQISSWPKILRMPVGAMGDVLFCHATPHNENDVFTRLTPESKLLPVFENLNASIVVCGHTHMQFDRMVGNVRVINAGSVGMPFGPAGADWLFFGDEPELRRTEYDLARAAERIRSTQYPLADDFATNYVLQQPSEAQMLDLFSRAEPKLR
jgi:putative phosphoesterase